MRELSSLACRLAHAWPIERWSDRKVLLAVSGGADSVALLRALIELRPAGASGRLIVGHVNHGLRGAESDADAQFVGKLAAQLQVEARVRRVEPVPAASDQGDGLEAAARSARYALLRDEAEAVGARYVVTAHTADDQAETILHRVLRGTGLDGLRGMRRARPLSDAVTLVRPLLEFRRAELRDYLAALGQGFREDTSNTDRRFTRNRLRHDLLPMAARDFNPEATEALLRLGRLAGDAQDAIAEIVDRELMPAITFEADGSLAIDGSALARWPVHLRREALKRAWQQRGWPMQAMGYDAWQRLAELVGSDLQKSITLPTCIRAARADGRIRLSRVMVGGALAVPMSDGFPG
ncbi:MAG TPA: tRNA lysidine(34) synthetase TilS [Pirellulales bacterium]|nr:tRNA lysidine(34) synthetase TilS [Pirellulales bacterium]